MECFRFWSPKMKCRAVLLLVSTCSFSHSNQGIVPITGGSVCLISEYSLDSDCWPLSMQQRLVDVSALLQLAAKVHTCSCYAYMATT